MKSTALTKQNTRLRRFMLPLALSGVAVVAQAQVFTTESARQTAQEFYIGYYGRPADPGGQMFWADRLVLEQSLESVLPAFGNSAEYDARFGGLSNTELVRKLYEQILDREPDPDGEAFYVAQLESGAMTPASVARSLIDGIQGDSDAETFARKVSVANHFTATLADVQAANPDANFAPAVYHNALKYLRTVEQRTGYLDRLARNGYCLAADDIVIPGGSFEYIDPLSSSDMQLARGSCSFGGMYGAGGTVAAGSDAILGDSANYDVVQVRFGNPIAMRSRCEGASALYQVFFGATWLYPVDAVEEAGTFEVTPSTSRIRYVEVCLDESGEAEAFHILAESRVNGIGAGAPPVQEEEQEEQEEREPPQEEDPPIA